MTPEEKLDYYQALRGVSVHLHIKMYRSTYSSRWLENGTMVQTPNLGEVQ
jgi:hypothetical protein